MPADPRPDWEHVADLATIHRDRNSEIRVALFEGRKGFACELRKYQRSHHHDGMNAAGIGLMIPVEKIGDVMLALEKARTAASALRGAA